MEHFQLEEYRSDELSEERLTYIYRKNWFKIFVPEDYGGLELSLVEGAKILTQAASMQGGFGWSLNLGAGANWFSGFFEERVAKQLFSPQNAVIAGSGFDSGSVKKVGNNITISGRWEKCTGAAYATLFSVNATDESGNVRSYVIPRDHVRFSPERWPIFGLKNSSSYSIEVDNVIIPEKYAFNINEIKNHKDYAVYSVPFESFARICMASSFIGIIQCLIREIENEGLSRKKLIYRDLSELNQLIAQSEKMRNEFAVKIERLASSGKLTEDFQVLIRKELGENNLKLFFKVQELFLNGGLSFVEENHMIHWCYRDMLTAAQHYMTKP
ncbi:MAG: hypothetical protein R3277_13025 [Brumimicrobium sp.]|nr:hypothetical protein [Brumimicrobium sp.]